MQALPRDVNPFALLLDPQAVLAQIVHSERLERLQRRVCRPLDKPMLGALAEDGEEPTEPAGVDAVSSEEDRLAASGDGFGAA